jgi:hypothetical protein
MFKDLNIFKTVTSANEVHDEIKGRICYGKRSVIAQSV